MGGMGRKHELPRLRGSVGENAQQNPTWQKSEYSSHQNQNGQKLEENVT